MGMEVEVELKIIQIDNFNRDNVSDSLVAENVPKFYARDIAEFLNEKYSGDTSSYFYEIRPDDYKLYTFEP